MNKAFEPIQIGTMEVKNRFLRSATWDNLADAYGHIREEIYSIYEDLAKNEAGLISTGFSYICKEEQPSPGMMGIYDDSFQKEYEKLTALCHRHGAKIMMQLVYGGTKTTYRTGERKIFAPSDIPEVETGTKGIPMTKNDIKKMIIQYADAAVRVKTYGFDAVQIHAGHSYLMNQFLSPYYNRREDCYGGNTENRTRFLREVCAEIRKRVGDFPILIKIPCSEFIENGLNFKESLEICKMLQDFGIDAIELTGNNHGKAERLNGRILDGHPIMKGCYFIEYGKIAVNHTALPVYVTGGVRDIHEVEGWLETTGIAGFGICRPLLSEPDLIYRWKNGNDMAARCLHCPECKKHGVNHCILSNS